MLRVLEQLGGHGIGEERKCRPKGDNEERKLGVLLLQLILSIYDTLNPNELWPTTYVP